MVRTIGLLVLSLCLATALASTACRRAHGLKPGGGPAPADAPPAAVDAPKPTSNAPPPSAQKVEIDLDKAIEIAMPSIATDLEPVSFDTKDARKGWAIRIPGGRPIATPAYADGLVFVGGGYGSHEFYAFDAETGKVVWQIKTSDDGPTAAVVEDGCVAFNTESCTVVVADAKTGNLLWQEWLGDPLMSQPAISKGKLYMAYPESKGDGQHHLLCAELKTGKHLWSTRITGDIISAPVIDGDDVYFTCFDGTAFCVHAGSGEVAWAKKQAGTSAPVIAEGQVMMTARQTQDGKASEGMLRLSAMGGEAKDQRLIAQAKAEYLEAGKGGAASVHGSAEQLDADVGFATAPEAAKLGDANENLGVTTVADGWAFQGSRAAYMGGRMMNGQGSMLNCFRSDTADCVWQAQARGAAVQDGMQVFSPPALGKRNMYLVTAQGHLLSVGQGDGCVQFLYATRLPMAFQPALANGNMYIGTANGMLVCLKTGDSDADGWTAWGGNAQHNKKD